ncbi:MAG: AMP-binding protein [Undibacterium sp.]|uniref:AMP-binding protein n=1 Tax=Undibacterium sp. TaxID=1914977 RepID=UPI0027290712|nr:AMP-binding protein [Undibacterium sp.]MDO8650610.1 AMP-binding protein [Undibacterium sp.]
MEKIWLKSFPPGVPAEVDLTEFTSLKDIFEWGCARYSELSAFSNQGTTITYRELDQQSRAFGAYLQNVLGLEKGDRIAIMMPNLLQYPVVLFGALRAGCTIVNTNPLYTARELRHQLIDSGAVCIVVLENFAHTLQEVLADTSIRSVITSRVGDLLHFPKAQIINFVVEHVKHMVPEWHISGSVALADALDRAAEMTLTDIGLSTDDVAFLQYTGGTTGVPKGAVLTHGNMVANLQQTVAWVKVALKEREEIVIIPLPLYHVFALTAMLTFFKLGSKIVLITNPRDIEGFVKELKHAKFSVMIGVNTLFNALLNAPDIGEVDTTNVKVVIGGGMAVQRAVAKKWHEVFGVPLIEGYGLTETSPIACANRLDIVEYTGMIGLPVPSTDAAILDEAGKELPLGELGEIGIRGPQVMKGYWNMPEETAKVFTIDGWLRTGDIGFMDAYGYIKLVDRKKDVIVVSGFKVFPNEIEEVVAMHPDVLEVAAISAADERSDQAVKIVVIRKNSSLTENDLIEHCRKNLTAYKVPKYVLFRDQPLPKSNVGKVLRRVVKDEVDAAEREMDAMQKS